MLGIVNTVKYRARQAARAAILSTVGGAFCLVGLGFLTSALWIIISTEYGQLMAALLIGGLYLVIGGAMLAFGRSPQSDASHYDAAPSHDPAAPPRRETDPIFQMAEGFAVGLQAGRDARKSR